jgi:hypothetical protein
MNVQGHKKNGCNMHRKFMVYTIRHVISQHHAREHGINYAEPVSMADSLHHSNIRHNPFDIHDVSVAVSTLVFRLVGNFLSITQA